MSGNEDILNMLIENGAEVNFRGFEGNAAIHLAASKGNRAIIFKTGQI